MNEEELKGIIIDLHWNQSISKKEIAESLGISSNKMYTLCKKLNIGTSSLARSRSISGWWFRFQSGLVEAKKAFTFAKEGYKRCSGCGKKYYPPGSYSILCCPDCHIKLRTKSRNKKAVGHAYIESFLIPRDTMTKLDTKSKVES